MVLGVRLRTPEAPLRYSGALGWEAGQPWGFWATAAGAAARGGMHGGAGLLVLGVDGQVEQVELALVVLLDDAEQHALRVLVRDMAQHQCGPLVEARHHLQSGWRWGGGVARAEGRVEAR